MHYCILLSFFICSIMDASFRRQQQIMKNSKITICKICSVEKTDSIDFHTHHIKPRSQNGSDEKENLVDICSDCHHALHYDESTDGELQDVEPEFKEAIDKNIFRDGWGIIPKVISHDKNISAFAKILYCDISSLCAERGYCWASNNYFANIFGVSHKTISRAIKEIEHYLIIRNRMSGKRTIWVHQLNANIGEFGFKKRKTPISKKAKQEFTKKKTKPKVEKVTKFDPFDLHLAELLLSKIIYNFPAFSNKKVNIEEWAEDIRKLREIDNATHEQIRFMITWVHGGEIEITGRPKRNFEPNEFWSKNILSARKLRKQWFDHLVPQLQSDLKKNIKKHASVQL